MLRLYAIFGLPLVALTALALHWLLGWGWRDAFVLACCVAFLGWFLAPKAAAE